MGIPTPARKTAHRLSFLKRPKVFPLDVFDERNLNNLSVVDLADDDRKLPQPDTNGRLISALTRDDLVAVAPLPDVDSEPPTIAAPVLGSSPAIVGVASFATGLSTRTLVFTTPAPQTVALQLGSGVAVATITAVSWAGVRVGSLALSSAATAAT